MPDRRTIWQRADSDEFPALPDSAVRLFTDEDRAESATPPYSGLPSILRMVTPRHGAPSIARWAPELRGHEAPLVSRDGRGTVE